MAKPTTFIGNHPKKWMKGVPLYGTVPYPDVYKGIDFLFQNNSGRLGYRIELDNGDGINEIVRRFSGHDGIRLNGQEEVEISTSVGRETWTAPHAFWDIAQRLIRAEATYVIHNDGSVGFAIEAPIRSDPLIIDPDLLFSIFLGRSGGDFITAQIIADNRNMAVAGSTTSLDFPLSSTAAQRNNAVLQDVFVTMLLPAKVTLTCKDALAHRCARLASRIHLWCTNDL